MLTPLQAPREHLPFGVPAATLLLHPPTADVEGCVGNCAVVVAAASRPGGTGLWGSRALLWREPCTARLTREMLWGWQRWPVTSACKQTFLLDGNMPEIAPLQIVFI